MDAVRNLGGPHPPPDQLKALRKITRAAQMGSSSPNGRNRTLRRATAFTLQQCKAAPARH